MPVPMKPKPTPRIAMMMFRMMYRPCRMVSMMPQIIPPEELARRKDWREELIITIDPVDAKDFDDAIWVRERERGWELGSCRGCRENASSWGWAAR